MTLKFINATEARIGTNILLEGAPYTIRFKSNGRHSNKILITDLIKGKRNLSENDFDIVIMKTDGKIGLSTNSYEAFMRNI